MPCVRPGIDDRKIAFRLCKARKLKFARRRLIKHAKTFVNSPQQIKMSIIDLCFYEELFRTAGHEVGSQWLKSSFGIGMKKRKSTFGRLGATFGPLSGSRTPETSNPSSPRSVASVADSGSHTDKIRLCAATLCCNDNLQVKASSPHQLAQQRNESGWQEQGRRASTSSSKLYPSLETEESTKGLLYTDAAHTILD